MPDIFDQEGITFFSSSMASTAPSAKPARIPAPNVQLPPSTPQLNASELYAPIKRGAIPLPPDPQQIAAQSLAGAGDEGSAAPGVAPPQASAPGDIFDNEGISPLAGTPAGANSFGRGVPIDNSSGDTEHTQVAQYASQQQAQARALASSRFTPEQMNTFANNPMTLSEAIQNQQDWPDVPALLQKHQNGEVLDDAQQGRLNEYIDSTLANHVRGMSWNGNIAVTGKQLPSAAISYVRAGDTGRMAQEGPAPAQPDISGSAVMPPPYHPQVGEKPLNEFMAVTDKGQQLMAGAKDKPASTALKAAAYALPGAADVPAHADGNLVSSIDQLPPSLRSALYDAYKTKNPKASMASMMTPQGWNKAVDAIGEDGAAEIVHWWTALTFEEHKAAQYVGGVLPLSEDTQGRVRFDPRAGLMSGVTAEGDILEGKLTPDDPEFYESARNTAFLALRPARMGKVGERPVMAERAVETAGGKEMAPADRVTPEPQPIAQEVAVPNVDKIMDILTPQKDQMLVDSGVVSIEGSKSAPAKTAENILQKKGMSEVQAQEAVANMTTNEREQFVSENVKAPKGIYQTTSQINAAGVPIESARSPAKFSEELSDIHGIDVSLEKTKNGLYLSAIKVAEGERGQGIGTAAMQDIIDYADSTGQRIELTPTQDYGASSVGRLKEFYKRFGFVENKGKNKDFSTRNTMYREPVSQQAAGIPTEDVATAVGNSQAAAATAKEPPAINDSESGFNALTQRLNYLYRRTVNTLDPIEQAEKLAAARGAKPTPGQSPKNLANLYGNVGAMSNHYLSIETFSWGKDGNTRITGKSLKGIMDDFDNIAMSKEKVRATRTKDFNDYLLAQRYLELEQIGEGKVKPKQLAWSKERLAALSDKYGDTLHLVENLAQEVYAMQRRTMDVLVDTGVVSRETADELAAKYPRYVPLDRVFDQADHEAYVKARDTLGKAAADPDTVPPAAKKAAARTMKKLVAKYGENIEENIGTPISRDGSRYKPTGKFSGAGAQGIIQKLKGSNRDAREPLANIYERTHKAIDRAYRNRVAVAVDNLKEVLPDYIQNEKPRMVNKGKAEVKITHDPILDQKLDAAIDYFKNKFQRDKSIKVKGYRNVLGSYDPMEKLIRTKLGANEAVKTHEVGHMLDYELGLGEKMLKDPKVKAELRNLALERIGGDVRHSTSPEGELIIERNKVGPKYKAYIRNDREIIANMFDASVNAPDLLEKIAPTAKAKFEQLIAENKELSFINDIKPSLAREERTIEKEVWGEAEELPPNTIEVYRDGERGLLRVAKPMYEAMTQLGPARVGFIEKLLRGTFGTSARILRTGATSTVSFIERNVFRDQMDAMIQGGVSYNAPWDFSKGLFAAFGHTELYKSWVRSGGKMHFMPMGDKGMEGSYKEMLNGTGRFKQLLQLLPKTSEKFEHATRIGLFNAAKRKGLSDLEASIASLEGTLNFGRSGDVTRKLNEYIPFLNAGVQGADKLIRTAANNPRLTLLWGLGTVTAPTVAISGYYLYAADEKTRQEYLEIPQWQKDMFWTIKVGDEWRTFPKPFSWGYIFGSIPERIMLHAYQGDKPEAKNMFLSTIQGLFGTLSPVNDWSATMPPILKVVAEWQSHYNFFMGRDIYPSFMDDLPPEQRKGTYTSKSAQFLGEHIGQSPALIENSIRDLTGGLGGYGLKAGDYILDQVDKWNDVPVAEKPATDADNILIQGFTMRDPMGTNSSSVQNFFDNYKLAKQAHLGEKNVPEDQIDAYRTNRQQQLAAYGSMERAHKDISGLQKEVMRIVKDTDMSGAEKKQSIRELNEQITDVARQANSEYSAAAPAEAPTGE